MHYPWLFHQQPLSLCDWYNIVCVGQFEGLGRLVCPCSNLVGTTKDQTWLTTFTYLQLLTAVCVGEGRPARPHPGPPPTMGGKERGCATISSAVVVLCVYHISDRPSTSGQSSEVLRVRLKERRRMSEDCTVSDLASRMLLKFGKKQIMSQISVSMWTTQSLRHLVVEN